LLQLLTSAHLDRLSSFQGVKRCKNLSQKSHILRELLQHHNPFGEEIEVKIGYARVSTAAQNLDSQLELLQQAGCQRIFQEHASGMHRQRAGLQRMQENLRPGDTVIVWKLDRLARSTRDLLETVEQIHHAEATFQSLSEPWADTTSHVGKFIMTVFAGLAQGDRILSCSGEHHQQVVFIETT
jgi:predicted site-specific integrase-resolvase